MSVGASAILEADRQAQWRLRQEQGAKKRRKSAWVIMTLRDYLPPEHVSLAHELARLQAIVEGCRVMESRVDGSGNNAEIAIAARMDAMRSITGYEAAARTAHGPVSAQCVRAIAESDTLAVTTARCGMAAGSHRSVRRLVQVTLEALSAYRDANDRAANTSGSED